MVGCSQYTLKLLLVPISIIIGINSMYKFILTIDDITKEVKMTLQMCDIKNDQIRYCNTG